MVNSYIYTYTNIPTVLIWGFGGATLIVVSSTPILGHTRKIGKVYVKEI